MSEESHFEPGEVRSSEFLAEVDGVQQQVDEQARHREDDDELEQPTRQAPATHPEPETVSAQHGDRFSVGSYRSAGSFTSTLPFILPTPASLAVLDSVFKGGRRAIAL